MRFEDLSGDPLQGLTNVSAFLGLTVTPEQTAYIQTHTRGGYGDKEGPHNQFRDSKIIANGWRSKLSNETVKEINSVCEQAMKLWGYEMK